MCVRSECQRWGKMVYAAAWTRLRRAFRRRRGYCGQIGRQAAAPGESRGLHCRLAPLPPSLTYSRIDPKPRI